MAKYAAALDQGTTSSRAMVFNHDGTVAAVSQKEHEQIYPKPGWVEHDPKEIWARSQEVLDEALEQATDLEAGLQAAVQGAEEGMRATIPLVARKGRASYLGERSKDHQDPGATSTYYLFKSAAEALSG